MKSTLYFQSGGGAISIVNKIENWKNIKEKKTTSVDEKEKVEVKLHAALVLNITYRAIYEPRRDTWTWQQGLEGYSRDPECGQNTVRDSGKRKISWRDSGIDCYQGSGIRQNLGTGCEIFCLSVGNSGNRHDLSERCSGKSVIYRFSQA